MNPDPVSRREALALASLGAASLLTASALAQPGTELGVTTGKAPPKGPTPKLLGWDEGKGEFVLPELPYAKNALEPHIDAQTMEIHHDKHHAAYVAGLNKALGELRRIREGQGEPALIKHWSRELAFHAAGHANHSLFWAMMAPAGKGGGGEPKGALAGAIDRDFGGFEKFAAQFKAAATQVEGGGWAWLMADPSSKRLFIHQSEKQQEMYVPTWRPVLGIDVWEHAYYLKYQNRRSDYVTAFMNVVDWGFAGALHAQAIA